MRHEHKNLVLALLVLLGCDAQQPTVSLTTLMQGKKQDDLSKVPGLGVSSFQCKSWDAGVPAIGGLADGYALSEGTQQTIAAANKTLSMLNQATGVAWLPVKKSEGNPPQALILAVSDTASLPYYNAPAKTAPMPVAFPVAWDQVLGAKVNPNADAIVGAALGFDTPKDPVADVEGIAAAPCSDGKRTCVFVADIGFNRLIPGAQAATKRSVLVYDAENIVESTLDAGAKVRFIKRIYIDFPARGTDQDGKVQQLSEVNFDFDTIIVSPKTSNWYFINKSIPGDGSMVNGLLPTLVYRITKDDWSLAADGGTLTASLLGRIPMEYLAATFIRTHSTAEQKQAFIGMLPNNLQAAAQDILTAKNLLDVQAQFAKFNQQAAAATGIQTIRGMWDATGRANKDASRVDAFYAVVTDGAMNPDSSDLELMTYRGVVQLKLDLDQISSDHPMPRLGEFLMENLYDFVNMNPLVQMEALTFIPSSFTEGIPNADLGLADVSRYHGPLMFYTTELLRGGSNIVNAPAPLMVMRCGGQGATP